MRPRCVSLLLLLFPASFVWSQEQPSSPVVVDFLKDVRPILKTHCFECHGPSVQESALRLDRKALAFQGGENGPVIVRNQVDKSRLLKLVKGQGPDGARMPPDGEGRPLKPAEIAVLKAWIAQGARWPDGIDDEADRLSLWSLRPIGHPSIPQVRDAKWVRNPVDAFILSQLEQHGLAPVAPAAPHQLLRRAWLDMVGFPPGPERVEAFSREPTPEAFARELDHLLANPHYGERWGRHWLDLVRYADTNGYEVDGIKPLAWKYRDWVIAALNADKPYDRFVVEQLAGDELPDADSETVLATGFFRIGPWDAERGASVQKSEVIEELYNELDDMVSTTTQVFLGLTMGCARCHDHKFDPLTARDYYSMVAVFRGLKREHKGRTELARAALPPAELSGKDPKTLPQGYFFFEPSPTPPKTHLLRRGNPNQPGVEVAAAVPVALVGKQPTFESPDKFTSRRRISLAHWIVGQDNPLTRRVIVNRVWQYHFGSGLVRSANDFGVRGNEPTHPELLDWLANWFRDEAGYSLKRLHRLIMSSNTYAMSKQGTDEQLEQDPDNLLLARFPLRRLEVEAIRDSMLVVSGRLNDRLYGAPMYPHIPGDALRSGYNPAGVWKPFNERDASRRTIYSFLKRTLLVPFLETLDFCDTARSAERREVTTVAPQALELFNGEFVNRQARHFADRLIAEVGEDVPAQVDRAFLLALGRKPTRAEQRRLQDFLVTQREHLLAKEKKRDKPSKKTVPFPNVVRRGLVMWLDAARGVTRDAGGVVTSWKDQTGKHDARALGNPRWIERGLRGQPAIELDGKGDDWFQISGRVVTSQAFTILAVVNDRTDGSAGSRNIVGNWDGSKGNSVSSVFLGTSSGPNNRRRVRFSDNYAPADKLLVAKPAEGFVLTGLAGQADVRVFQNSKLLGRKGSALVARNLETAWTIGRQGTLDSEYWQGQIAEILVYNHELSSSELASVWKYLGMKYRLPELGQPPVPLTAREAHRRALIQVCRVLFNLNEFVYTD